MSGNRISLSIPLEARWLPLAESTGRQFAGQFGFPQKAQDHIAFSISEACEELIRLAGETGRGESCAVSFDYQAPAILADITYDGKIPLNPYQAEEYEVPDITSDMDSLDVEALWLHLIKKRMDRVYFRIRGGQHILHLVKYRRSEGEEQRPWSFSLTPALKEGLNVAWASTADGLTGVLLQDTQTGKVLQFGPLEALAIRAMNGRSTLYDIFLECVETRGPFSPQRMTVLFELLESSGMLAEPAGGKPENVWRKVLRKLLNPVFSIPRADALVESVYLVCKPLTGWAGLLLCLGAGLSGLVPLLRYRLINPAALAGLEQVIRHRPEALLALYCLSVAMMAVHELAHGLVCKRFGGQVPRLGVMVYLGSIIFFCDTTASLNFPQRLRRIMVSLAGPLSTFALLGAGLWAAAPPAGAGPFWGPVWLMFCLFCFFSLVLTANPFIRMDAYYVLLDLTGIANLRERSFRFIGRRLTGRPAPGEGCAKRAPAAKERVVYWLYGLTGTVVTVLFFLWPLLWCARQLARESPDRGQVFMIVVAVGLAFLSLGRAAYSKLRSYRQRDYKLSG